MSYVPDMTGRYTITIKYGGDNIPYSPYNVQAFPTGDASKCLLTGIISILVICDLKVLCSCFTDIFFLLAVSIGGHGVGKNQKFVVYCIIMEFILQIQILLVILVMHLKYY